MNRSVLKVDGSEIDGRDFERIYTVASYINFKSLLCFCAQSIWEYLNLKVFPQTQIRYLRENRVTETHIQQEESHYLTDKEAYAAIWMLQMIGFAFGTGRVPT